MYFSINAHFLNILISNNINLSFIRKALQRNPLVFFFFKDFIYLLLERGEKKEKERERHINVWWLPLARPLTGTWPATQTCALTRNQTGDPLVHRPALNPLSHTSKGSPCFCTSARNLAHSRASVNRKWCWLKPHSNFQDGKVCSYFKVDDNNSERLYSLQGTKYVCIHSKTEDQKK